MSESSAVDLGGATPPGGRESTVQLLVRALLEEQSQVWRRGQRVPVEAYQARHPSLESDPEGLLDLIYHEVMLRQERGETPRPLGWRADDPGRLVRPVKRFGG
jgi:hypothetical protein